MKNQVIHITTENLEQLVFKVIEVIQQKYGSSLEDWIDEREAMRLLNIKSKTTMGLLRSKGQILYSQPMKKLILYSKISINEYLNKHARNTF